MQRSHLHRQFGILAVGLALLGSSLPAAAQSGDSLVNTGSTPAPFSQNKQNEPALAVDASHPTVLVAGANDLIDMEACNADDDTTCPFTTGVGNNDPPCQPQVGPIGTLPWYYEAGLVTDGDPAVAFGPRPGANGKFSWANGSRLYYATLVSNLSAKRNDTFKGYEAIAVSRTDDVATAALGGATGQNAWERPVIVTNQNG